MSTVPRCTIKLLSAYASAAAAVRFCLRSAPHFCVRTAVLAEYNYSTAAPPSMQNDTITISRHHSNDPAVKLAICHALAQVSPYSLFVSVLSKGREGSHFVL
jgi:hypothetical protein